MPTIEVQYDEEVVIDGPDGDDEIRIDADAVYVTGEQAVEVADALYEAAGEQPTASLPANAVRAKDIPLNEALIRVAAAHGARISFRYAKSDGSPVEARTFAPASVKVMPDHVTFVGYDEDRDGMRSFRSDRIKGLVAVNA